MHETVQAMTDVSERREALSIFSGYEVDYPSQTIVELIEEQVARTPDETAVVFQDVKLTFGELNERANHIAYHLRRERSLRPDERVGLLLERSDWMVTAILGVLKAGGAYVPLDSEYPAERQSFILNDSRCRVLLTESKLMKAACSVESDGLAVLDVRRIEGEAGNPPIAAGLDNLAYVLYTSGSTGLPKGVLMEHRALANLFHALQELLYARLGARAREALSAPFVFDASAQQTLSSLANGNTLYVVEDEIRREPGRLIRYLCEHQINICNVVAPFLSAMLEEGLGESVPRSLRQIVTGGESVSPALISRFFAHERCHGIRIANMYGPTENCVDSTCSLIDEALPSSVSTVTIGRPLPNVQVYILDEELETVAVGVAGEICVSGKGLARGYCNRNDLTALKFIPHPFRVGERLYRTGDLGRWRPDGIIEFLGRTDDQVKIHGFRIELGEIEGQLLRHPEVREAVVLAEPTAEGSKRLVAYISGDASLSIDELRSRLKSGLPGYMIPSAFVKLKELPHTHNGKVDKKALAALGTDERRRERISQPPRDETESRLAVIWQEVLGVESVSVDDDFFEVGGHSLKATQLAGRIRQHWQIELPLRDVFEHPTIAGLAQRVKSAAGRELPPIPLQPARDFYELSHAQERLWLLHQMKGGDVAYNVPIALLEERLDVEALRRAFKTVIERHEILRTSFIEIDGAPQQRVHPTVPFDIELIDLRGTPDAERRAREIAGREALKPFDLTEPTLFRASVVRLMEERSLFLLTIHHIICDGWSLTVLFNEINSLYDAERLGRTAHLPPLPLQYKDYAVWHNNREFEREERYWLEQLSGAPEMVRLPFDLPPSVTSDFRGSTEARELDAGLAKGLRKLAARKQTTLSNIMLTLFALWLYRLTGQSDICIGMGVANRTHPDLERLIGFFVNVLPIRIRLNEELSVEEILNGMIQTAYEAFEHQDYPIDLLIRRLNPGRRTNRQPLFNVLYAFQNFSDLRFGIAPADPFDSVTADGSAAGILDKSRFFEQTVSTSKFDLTLYVHEEAETIRLTFEYDTGLFRPETIGRYLSYFERLAQLVVSSTAEGGRPA